MNKVVFSTLLSAAVVFFVWMATTLSDVKTSIAEIKVKLEHNAKNQTEIRARLRDHENLPFHREAGILIEGLKER